MGKKRIVSRPIFLVILFAGIMEMASCYPQQPQDPQWKRIWEHADEYQEDKDEDASPDDEKSPVLPLDPSSKPCVSSELEDAGCGN